MVPYFRHSTLKFGTVGGKRVYNKSCLVNLILIHLDPVQPLLYMKLKLNSVGSPPLDVKHFLL